MNDNSLHNRLKSLHTEASQSLVRDLEIELLEPENSTSKSGRAMTLMTWRYRNPLNNDGEWITRKSPMFSKETKLLLEHDNFEPGALYRVTANKNARDYWEWTKIEPVENNAQKLDGDQ